MPSLFEKLTTPEDIFSFKLGSALKMEEDILSMLDDLQETTNRDELRRLFATHQEETRGHVDRIKQCFQLLGEEIDDSANPVTKGLAAEVKTLVKKTDEAIVDDVLLGGAIETEHVEIATYEILVNDAHARGAEEVAALLQQNLDEEKNALKLVSEAAHRIAREGWAQPAA